MKAKVIYKESNTIKLLRAIINNKHYYIMLIGQHDLKIGAINKPHKLNHDPTNARAGEPTT